jgi:DNA-binding response OmpR family regulator
MRILIIEDNHDAGESLRLLLEAVNHDVRHVISGEAGVEEAGAFRPHVVLLDLGLPGIQGHEAAVRIRETVATSPLTIVAISGWGRDSDREASRAARVDHHLVKPIDFAALQALLDSISA